MIDLNDVALFVQVVKAGSFAEAARRIGIPSNTASRRIQQLEEQLGLRLLHRSTRKLTLTDAGETLYARSAAQIDALSEAALELGEGTQTPSGKVRVAAAADFFNWFDVRWAKEFLAAYPRVTLEFVLSDARADLIAEGIDVAVRAGEVTEPTLIARHIGRNRACLVASPSYLEERGVPQSPDDLKDHDCIAARSAPGRLSWYLDGPNGPVEAEVHGRFFANSALTLLKASVAGAGIALLPDVMCAPHLQNGQLVLVLPDYGIDGVNVYLVYQSRRQMPRAVSAFIDFAMTKLVETGLVTTGV
ncbi:LysR family transcriptional regulator [Stenotrophomonas sp. SY1]|uniref:LysR family transcriptional regulator n=1 Tax=Stenotrophomonas sp. SY1 TaxID=477235 RepID=UPI001E30320A|nr:LysR family transcriptional regulator [Stenotrophomonas sp. SY1]MCD9087007.1 LysR family transcriptional regulator [Stenotrophomonas sp. SY1]